MAVFANAIAGADPSSASLGLAWLAGLLEAEGTFLRPPPSMPDCPIVACRMTDLDVVERVAAQFGTAVMTNDKGKYRTEFAAVLKGAGAAALMSDIRRLMGRRRKAAIDAAIADYCPPSRKLDFATAQEIRRRFAAGNSVASLAHTYDVARQTIYPILQNRARDHANLLRSDHRNSPGMSVSTAPAA